MQDRIHKTLDLKGLRCPLPVLKVKKQMKSLSAGSIIEVFTDDPASIEDLKSYCETSGDNLLYVEENFMIYRFVIKKN